MKYLIITLLLLSPLTTYGAFQIGNGTETCFQYGTNIPYTTDESGTLELHISLDTYGTDYSKMIISGGTLDFANLISNSLPTRPVLHIGTILWTDSGGWSIKYTDSREFIIQDEKCTTPEPATSTATSTASLGDISFGLAIIITLMSLGLVGFIFNTLNKKK